MIIPCHKCNVSFDYVTQWHISGSGMKDEVSAGEEWQETQTESWGGDAGGWFSSPVSSLLPDTLQSAEDRTGWGARGRAIQILSSTLCTSFYFGWHSSHLEQLFSPKIKLDIMLKFAVTPGLRCVNEFNWAAAVLGFLHKLKPLILHNF